MIKKEDNIEAKAITQIVIFMLIRQFSKENLKEQISNTSKFEWPNSYWFIAERMVGWQ